MSFILQSYGDTSIREDVVLNAIEYLTAMENYVFNRIGSTTALNTVHSYLTDTYPAAQSRATAEAADFSNTSLTTPTRLTNIQELITYKFEVSKTQRRVSHYQGEDELQRQVRKGLVIWTRDAEFDLVRGTLTSGLSGTAPVMSGLIEATSKSTNHTTHTSGTTLVASILDGLIRGNWNNGNGDTATDLIVGSYLKDVINNFTQKSQVTVNAPSGMREIVKTTDTYLTSFGTINVQQHRLIQISTDATGRLMAFNPTKLRKAWLQMPFVDEGLTRAGDYEPRAVIGQFTLEVHNQDSNWFADGLNIG